MLSGDGSDELFAGYNRHQAFYRAIHPGVTEEATAVIGKWLPSKGNRENKWANKMRQVKRFAHLKGLPYAAMYDHLSSFASKDELLAIGCRPVPSRNWIFGEKNLMQDYLQHDQRFILPGDMLVKADRMGMAHSLEIRTPFLDHRIVELARTLEEVDLIERGKGKLILRNSFSHLLPKTVFQRPKHGFEIPIKRWIQGPWLEKIVHQLRPEIVDQVGVCQSEKIANLLNEIPTGQFNPSLVWSLFVLHRWTERHILS